jgi:beta-lactamase class D
MLYVAALTPVRAQPFECTLIIDLSTGKVQHRDGICDRRVTPMSTFKLPLALIGFDAGILQGNHEPIWRYRKEFGGPARVRKPVDPTIWQADSIVWYSQEITRRLGSPAFERYVAAFKYGNADLSGVPGREDGLTHAWLGSSLAISAEEQALFIRSMLLGELPASDEALRLTRAVVPTFAAGGWRVHGKTGSGWMRGADGEWDKSRPVGWFVGWAERGNRSLVFARLSVGDKPMKGASGLGQRDEFLRRLPDLARSLQ